MLAHERIGDPSADLACWFLHGIFGAGRNWRTVALRCAKRRPGWQMVTVDLREHGGSRGLSPPHDLQACAKDLERLAAHLGSVPDAVVGHSFGGKVALAYARGAPAGLRQVWVVDVSPAARAPAGSATEMLEAVRELPERFEDRETAVEALRGRGFELGVARWMSTNLERSGADDGAFRWRFDVEAIGSLLESFFATDLWEAVTHPPQGSEVRVVKATRSDALDEADCDRIEAAGRSGAVRLHRVEGGHWLNADAPDRMVELLAEGLPGPPG